MPAREIPRSQWREFFDNFSRQHQGWLTTIEVAGGELSEDQLEATELPFQGISADSKGSDPDAIEVTVGGDETDEITHIVHNAARVVFEQTASGGHEGLDIESASGEKTSLRFRFAGEPEELDEVAEGESRTRRAGGR